MGNKHVSKSWILRNGGKNQVHMEGAGMREENLAGEWLRVADICNGCRRSFRLCPSFETLFSLLYQPAIDGVPERLPAGSLDRTLEGCNYCKLCFNHCPYCPPHAYMLDFPSLMLRAKANRFARGEVRISERLMEETDRLGRLGTRFSGMVNAALKNAISRRIAQSFLGLHARAPILPYAHQTFEERYRERARPHPLPSRDIGDEKVVLFATCLGNYQDPDIPDSVMRILEHQGIPVVFPGSVCCGMPHLDTGNLSGFRESAERVLKMYGPYVREGYKLVAPVPTCTMTLKKEYAQHAPEVALGTLAGATWDFFQYLNHLKNRNLLRTDFKRGAGRIAYHVPCHLRDQNIGAPVREILNLLPDTRVTPYEMCSGHGGTWGVQVAHFPDALKRAEKTAAGMAEGTADRWISDCPLAGGAIGAAAGRIVEHPAVLLRQAYGL